MQNGEPISIRILDSDKLSSFSVSFTVILHSLIDGKTIFGIDFDLNKNFAPFWENSRHEQRGVFFQAEFFFILQGNFPVKTKIKSIQLYFPEMDRIVQKSNP